MGYDEFRLRVARRLYTRTLERVSWKLSKGLKSLPDELLGIILKFATLDSKEATRHAVWLSYVSRSFRKILLGDHSLWSTLGLWYDMSKEITERCICRSGKDTDLHIVVNYNCFIKPSAVRDFMDACSSSASRWRSLTLAGNWNEHEDAASVGQTMDSLMEYITLVLPRLEELSISERHYDEFEGGPFWNMLGDTFDSTPWEAPNLRIVQCTQYIPPPLFPFTSFTSFTLSLTLLSDGFVDQIGKLFSFLSSKPNISTLVLEFVNFDDADFMEEDLDINLTVCPAISSYHLIISNFITVRGAYRTFGPTTRALKMPNLERFSLSFKNCGVFPSSTGMLLPNPNDHPLLISFIVDVQFPERGGARYHIRTESWSQRTSQLITSPMFRPCA